MADQDAMLAEGSSYDTAAGSVILHAVEGW